MSTDHNPFLAFVENSDRRAEAELNSGPSVYQPNALPLGQIILTKYSPPIRP